MFEALKKITKGIKLPKFTTTVKLNTPKPINETVKEKMVVILNVGHGQDIGRFDPGACNQSQYNGMCEFKYNDEIVKKLTLAMKDVPHIEVKTFYQRSWTSIVNDLNAIGGDLIVSFHCNAATPQATGTEVLYFARSQRGMKVAEIFQRNIVNTLGLSNRGIKARTIQDRGGALLERTKAVAIILEPFFISNDNDVKTALKKEDELIQTYKKSLIEYYNIIKNK